MSKYPKYTWVGNKIADKDMRELYRIKQITKKPITQQVSEAVSKYIVDKKGVKNEQD